MDFRTAPTVLGADLIRAAFTSYGVEHRLSVCNEERLPRCVWMSANGDRGAPPVVRVTRLRLFRTIRRAVEECHDRGLDESQHVGLDARAVDYGETGESWPCMSGSIITSFSASSC